MKNLCNLSKEELIKIAEEQIKTLGDIQASSITDEKVLVGASVEIRNWCEFLSKINNPLQKMQGVTNQDQEQYIDCSEISVKRY